MDQDMKRYLHKLMKTVDGLHAIVITDRDGVPIIKVADEHAPDLSLRPKFLSTSSMAMDQAGKLGLGNGTSAVAVFGNYQVVCFSRQSLVLTMMAESSANTGSILSLPDQMEDALRDITAAVRTS